MWVGKMVKMLRLWVGWMAAWKVAMMAAWKDERMVACWDLKTVEWLVEMDLMMAVLLVLDWVDLKVG